MGLAQAITESEALIGLILPLVVAFVAATIIVIVIMYAAPKTTKDWRKKYYIPIAVIVILGIVIYILTAGMFTASVIS